MGVRVLFSISTYSFNLSVSIIAAYVDGLPIPSFSRFLIKLASVYLPGGWVKCWTASTVLSFITSPSCIGGRIFDSASKSSSSDPSKYTCIKPGYLIDCPDALKVFSFVPRSTDTESKIASFIWEATVLFHIKEYNSYWSLLRYFFTSSGFFVTEDGLIASWASWAFFEVFEYTLFSAGRESFPYRSGIISLISLIASCAKLVESVLM